MSCHLGTDSPPHAGRPAPQTPLLRLLSGQGQDAGRAKPGQKEQQPQTLSLRLARERLLAGPGGPGLGSFAAPAVSGALLFPHSQACLEPSGFFLDVVPDILSSQLLQVLLSGSGPVCTPGDASDPHRGGVVVGGGVRRRGQLQSERSSSPGEAPVCLFPHPGLQGPLACGRTPQPLPLSPHGRPPPGLSCRIRRRVGFTAPLDRPAWSHPKTVCGGQGGSSHRETLPSDSIPSWLPARVCFQGALLLPPAPPSIFLQTSR